MTAIHLHRARSTDDVTQALREAKKRAQERKAAQEKQAATPPDESFAAMGEADRLEMEERGYGT